MPMHVDFNVGRFSDRMLSTLRNTLRTAVSREPENAMVAAILGALDAEHVRRATGSQQLVALQLPAGASAIIGGAKSLLVIAKQVAAAWETGGDAEQLLVLAEFCGAIAEAMEARASATFPLAR